MIPLIRSQLARISSAAVNEPIEKERRLQRHTAKIMQRLENCRVTQKTVPFAGFDALLIVPRLKRRGVSQEKESSVRKPKGIILYVHGGGYVSGDKEYAQCYGKMLATLNRVPVFCPVYQLAPEHPFPAALQNVFQAYRYLLKFYRSSEIVLVGESAGGGLIFSLCLKLKQKGLPLPAGLAAISPWTDLTQSGASYSENEKADPSMKKARLDQFARYYTAAPENPFCSPLFGDLTGLPESILFAGGDEIMKDDAVRICQKLRKSGCKSSLVIAEGMWHAYLLYGFAGRRADYEKLRSFIKRRLPEIPIGGGAERSRA